MLLVTALSLAVTNSTKPCPIVKLAMLPWAGIAKTIGVDFGGRGADRAHTPNNWETPMLSSVIAILCSPNILVSPQYFWQVYASGQDNKLMITMKHRNEQETHMKERRSFHDNHLELPLLGSFLESKNVLWFNVYSFYSTFLWSRDVMAWLVKLASNVQQVTTSSRFAVSMFNDSVSIIVQKEDVHSQPGLEFWTYIPC